MDIISRLDWTPENINLDLRLKLCGLLFVLKQLATEYEDLLICKLFLVCPQAHSSCVKREIYRIGCDNLVTFFTLCRKCNVLFPILIIQLFFVVNN